MIKNRRRKKLVAKVDSEVINQAIDSFWVKGDVAGLTKYVTERGKILGRTKTGVSAKDQRRLTKFIKYARHLGLLPFVNR